MSDERDVEARASALRELAQASVAEFGHTAPYTLPTAGLLALGLRHRIPAPQLWLWLALVVVDLGRGAVRNRRDRVLLAEAGSVDRWLRIAVPHQLAFGLTWGVLALLGLVHRDRGVVTVALVVSLAITAIMVGTTAFRRQYAPVALGILGPGIVSGIALGGDTRLLGILGLAYLVLMFGVQGRLADARLHAAELVHVNIRLAAELDREHGHVRWVNERLSEANEMLSHRAQHDPLTGLANRVLVVETLTDVVRTAAPGSLVAVFYCDLDGFKPINDTHGHQAGDHLLVAVAKRLRSAVGGDDLVARLGGDEFVVVASGLAAPDQAVPIAERLRQAAGAPFAVEGLALSVGISIGVATADRFCSANELLRLADEALYSVKHGDRGGIAMVAVPEPTGAPELRRA